MIELQQYGFIYKKEGDKKKGFVYGIVSDEEYNRLQQSIDMVLNEVLRGLRGSQVVQLNGKPLKAATAKERKQVVQ